MKAKKPVRTRRDLGVPLAVTLAARELLATMSEKKSRAGRVVRNEIIANLRRAKGLSVAQHASIEALASLLCHAVEDPDDARLWDQVRRAQSAAADPSARAAVMHALETHRHVDFLSDPKGLAALLQFHGRRGRKTEGDAQRQARLARGQSALQKLARDRATAIHRLLALHDEAFLSAPFAKIQHFDAWRPAAGEAPGKQRGDKGLPTLLAEIIAETSGALGFEKRDTETKARFIQRVADDLKTCRARSRRPKG